MKIKRIKVEKLFGLEDNDFDIECYPKGYVTILYAFNGVGKTTLLRLIDAVLSVKMHILDSIAFKKIEIYFDGDEILAVEKLGDYKNKFTETKCKDLYVSPANIPVYPIKYVIKTDKGIREYYLKLSEGFTAEVKRNPEITVGEINEIKEIKIERRIEAIKKGEQIKLANVNEDDLEKRPVNPLLFEYDAYIFFDLNDLRVFRDDSYELILQNYHSNLMLSNKQFDIQPRSDLDPSFEMFRNYPPSLDDLYLTDGQNDFILYLNQKLKNENKDSSYEKQIPIVQDKTKKICEIIKNRFRSNRNSEELKLFNKLLNETFGYIYKTIEFDEQKGLKVVPIYKGDPELDVMKLSSGEKKLIIILYNLLFEFKAPGKENAQSIILIDEPETSLHIEWQSHIIEGLLEICKKFDIQIILTTHSPEIVGEYDELTTKLISERFKYERFFKI